MGPRASNSCSVSFFHLLPHLHPQDKLAVKPCVAAAEHNQPAVHIKHQGLLGEPLLAGVAVTQLQGEVEQGWVQHPVLVEDYQHHLPDWWFDFKPMSSRFSAPRTYFFLAKETKMLRFLRLRLN